MKTLDIVLLTGISGSGKSVALNALEDAGYFCVDNLPPELLGGMIDLEAQRAPDRRRRVAVSVDVRSADSLPHLMPTLQQLQTDGHKVRSVFLDASTDALVRRFSETRRPHPLSQVRAVPAAATDTPRRRASDHDATLTATADQVLIDAIRTERGSGEPEVKLVRSNPPPDDGEDPPPAGDPSGTGRARPALKRIK